MAAMIFKGPPLAAGCDDFDIKPVDRERLRVKIRGILARKRA